MGRCLNGMRNVFDARDYPRGAISGNAEHRGREEGQILFSDAFLDKVVDIYTG